MQVKKFTNKVINTKNDFRQVSSWQCISHVSAAAVTLGSVNRYERLSRTFIILNLVIYRR